MTEGPGEDSPGGVTFRLGWWAKLRDRMKPWEPNPLLRGSILGYDTRTIRVIGGVTWTKWLTTLTGERFLLRPQPGLGQVAVTPIYKSKTKRAADAMERGRRLASLVKGWQLFRSSRNLGTPGAVKGRTVGKLWQLRQDREKVSSAVTAAPGLPVPLSGNPPQLRNAFKCLA